MSSLAKYEGLSKSNTATLETSLTCREFLISIWTIKTRIRLTHRNRIWRSWGRCSREGLGQWRWAALRSARPTDPPSRPAASRTDTRPPAYQSYAGTRAGSPITRNEDSRPDREENETLLFSHSIIQYSLSRLISKQCFVLLMCQGFRAHTVYNQ